MTPCRRPRVILLGPAAPIRGGMANVVDTLSTSTLSTEFELATLNTGKTTREGRPWHAGVWSQLRLAARLTAMLVRGHGDIVHIHTCSGPAFWRDSVLLLIARLFRARGIWHVHGGGFDEFITRMDRGQRALLAWAFSMGEVVVVLSASWRARLARHLRVPRWAVVENGVPLPPPIRRSPAVDTLLFVGTLGNDKGAADLVAATAFAVRRGFSGRVHMAGRETAPGQRRSLEELIRREGLSGRLQLLGLVVGDEKVRAFETAGMFALPSYVEGLPIALLEAMSYGLPVIATNVGAIPEVVTDGVEGFLIAPGDIEALAERMVVLGTDAELRDKMGAAARRRIEDGYTVATMVAKMADVYRAATLPSR